MIQVLKNRTYAALFSAQVIAVLGTGLLTVALGLLAYDLAGAQAGVVLGVAYTIKMVAYVGLAPIMAAVVARMPRRAVLIGADVIRAGVAMCLPFVDQLWQIYVLIFVLQAASATFTPVFQSVIPDILPDEDEYTQALSMSRLAYDLENLLSPALAGLLLLVMRYHWLFSGTMVGFLASAVLVFGVTIPAIKVEKIRPFRERLTRGIRIYLATPRLRGLLALNFAASSVGAFVLVNSVVVARAIYGGSEADLAVVMAGFGAGSMFSALVLPRLLTTIEDRVVMMQSAVALVAVALGFGGFVAVFGWPGWAVFCLVWGAIGVLYSAILTPSGRLLRRSAHDEDRPAVFAAQFALSHACWLVGYPVAGIAGAVFGLEAAMVLLALMALGGVIAARVFWPRGTTQPMMHSHPDLAADHPHMRNSPGLRHAHVVVIDDEHRVWPTQG